MQQLTVRSRRSVALVPAAAGGLMLAFVFSVPTSGQFWVHESKIVAALLALGLVAVSVVAFIRPMTLLTANGTELSLHSALGIGKLELVIPWRSVRSVRGDCRLVPSDEGWSEEQILFVSLLEPSLHRHNIRWRGQSGTLEEAVKELNDPNMVVWLLHGSESPAAEVATRLETLRSSSFA